MFDGDFADTCAGKYPLMSMGGLRKVSFAQTRERGPHRHERKFKIAFGCWVVTIFSRYYITSIQTCEGSTNCPTQHFLHLNGQFMSQVGNS